MFLNRLKVVGVLALAFVVTCTGAGVLLSRAPAADPPAAGGKAAKEPAPKAAAPASTIQVKNFAIEAIDVGAGTVTVAERNLPHALGMVIRTQDAELLHLVTVKVGSDKPEKGKPAQIELKQPKHSFLSVLLRESTGNQPKLQNLPVAKDVTVTLDGRSAKLADLTPGMVVDLTLGAHDGRLVIQSIQARKDGAKK